MHLVEPDLGMGYSHFAVVKHDLIDCFNEALGEDYKISNGSIRIVYPLRFDDERNQRCTQKYNRPFNVAPSGDSSIKKYPKEYKIKYSIGFKGKPTEKPLNLHLRVGNDSDNLLRIYFLYDVEKKLIVVGSLPRHLSTMSE